MSHIDSLVERFWNAESNEQEEEILKSLSDNESFKVRHPKTAQYFQSTLDYKNITLTEEQKKELLNISKKKNNSNFKLFWISGLAASLALMFWISTTSNSQEYSDKEIELAYQQTKEALLLVSSKIDEGQSYTSALKHLDRSQRQVINEIQLN